MSGINLLRSTVFKFAQQHGVSRVVWVTYEALESRLSLPNKKHSAYLVLALSIVLKPRGHDKPQELG